MNDVNEESRRLEVTPEGVFIVSSRKLLRLRSLKARKTRLEGQILRLHQEQRYHMAQIEANNKKTGELELELSTFNSPEILAWIERRERQLAEEREGKREERKEANQRARHFLREYIGEEAYAKLRKQGFLEFEGGDRRAYRIDSKGQLYRGGSRVCVIHPRSLPLPDFIVSVLTTVKEGRLGLIRR